MSKPVNEAIKHTPGKEIVNSLEKLSTTHKSADQTLNLSESTPITDLIIRNSPASDNASHENESTENVMTASSGFTNNERAMRTMELAMSTSSTFTNAERAMKAMENAMTASSTFANAERVIKAMENAMTASSIFANAERAMKAMTASSTFTNAERAMKAMENAMTASSTFANAERAMKAMENAMTASSTFANAERAMKAMTASSTFANTERAMRSMQVAMTASSAFNNAERMIKTLESAMAMPASTRWIESIENAIKGISSFNTVKGPDRVLFDNAIAVALNGVDRTDEALKELSGLMQVSQTTKVFDETLEFGVASMEAELLTMQSASHISKDQVSRSLDINDGKDAHSLLLSRFAALPRWMQNLVLWALWSVIFGAFTDYGKEKVLIMIHEAESYATSLLKGKALTRTEIQSENKDIDWNQLNQFRIITGENINLRKSPSMKGDILETLNKNTIVLVLDKEGRQWVYVKTYSQGKTITGWVNRSFTKQLGR
ncbi:SH3 domain-containing protein [Enterobacter kobei]